MGLSGQQRQQLQEALLDAFPTSASLEQMLAYGLDKNLSAIAGEGSLQEIIFKLIQTANAEGWIEDLVRVTRESNPGNLKLQAVALHMNVNLNYEDNNYFKRGIVRQDYVLSDFQNGENIYEDIYTSNNANIDIRKIEKKLNNNKLNYIEKYNYDEFVNLDSNHKYPNLILINIRIMYLKFERDLQQFNLLLDISFGEAEENFKYKEKLGFVEKEGYIKFGIKFGELCFKLTNGRMPLNLRKLPTVEQAFGLVSSTGTEEHPIWQFRVNDKKRSILFGSLTDQELGTMLLQNTTCLVETTFHVNVNSNNLGVTEQEGVWDDETNKKVKETKLRAFFKKVVEPKIKDYLSKVVLQYDSTTHS